jgi:hypothetical protein
MREFRAYILGEDGHIVRAIEFVCPNEGLAKEYAKQLADGHNVELWEGERPLETFGKYTRSLVNCHVY